MQNQPFIARQAVPSKHCRYRTSRKQISTNTDQHTPHSMRCPAYTHQPSLPNKYPYLGLPTKHCPLYTSPESTAQHAQPIIYWPECTDQHVLARKLCQGNTARHVLPTKHWRYTMSTEVYISQKALASMIWPASSDLQSLVCQVSATVHKLTVPLFQLSM
jgi:hypothetical protein